MAGEDCKQYCPPKNSQNSWKPGRRFASGEVFSPEFGPGRPLPQVFLPHSSRRSADAHDARNGPLDADLAAVVEAWPGLSEAVRESILATVQAGD